LVYDGDSTVTLYVDGRVDATARRRYSTTPRGTAYIGYSNPGHHFEGTIDDFMIFNKALTSKEVKALYSQRD